MPLQSLHLLPWRNLRTWSGSQITRSASDPSPVSVYKGPWFPRLSLHVWHAVEILPIGHWLTILERMTRSALRICIMLYMMSGTRVMPQGAIPCWSLIWILDGLNWMEWMTQDLFLLSCMKFQTGPVIPYSTSWPRYGPTQNSWLAVSPTLRPLKCLHWPYSIEDWSPLS